jgi:membrane protein
MAISRRRLLAALRWPGHEAQGAHQIPLAGWRQIAGRVWRSIGEDQVTSLAAGLAFYSLMALFPTLIAAITLYGLVADPAQVQDLVGTISGTMSGGGQVVRDQLTQIVSTSGKKLSWGLVLSLGAALWSASAGAASLITTINRAYDERETRGYFRLKSLAMVLTVGGILFVLVAVALIAILPVILDRLGLGDTGRVLVAWLRWPLLLTMGMTALAVVYKIAPNRRPPRIRWVTWGSAIAMALWIAASWGFSTYVENFASYNETYGSLGGVVILLMWFYLSGFSILLGAEINAEIELQTGVDTTVGEPRPRGERGAVKADFTPLDEPPRRLKSPR